MVIVGSGAVARADGAAVLAAARAVTEKFSMVRDDWNGFNVLHRAASRVGGLDLGFIPSGGGRDVAAILEGTENGAVKFVWLLGSDEIEMARLNNAFVVYQGHHGDAGAAEGRRLACSAVCPARRHCRRHRRGRRAARR